MANVEMKAQYQEPPLNPDESDGPLSPGETGAPGSMVLGAMAMLGEVRS